MTRPRLRDTLAVHPRQPWWVNWIIANRTAIECAVIGLALVLVGWAGAVAALRIAVRVAG